MPGGSPFRTDKTHIGGPSFTDQLFAYPRRLSGADEVTATASELVKLNPELGGDNTDAGEALGVAAMVETAQVDPATDELDLPESHAAQQ